MTTYDAVPDTVPDRAHTDAAEVLDRRAGRSGELVLRRSGAHFEVVEDGVFLMDTRDGRSERLLVSACLDRVPADRDGLAVVIGGLGVGFSLLEALASPRVARVVVVELEPALVGWHTTHLAGVTGGALDDPRVEVVEADLAGWLRGDRSSYDAICLDVDNGPDWLVRADNAAVYSDDGLAALAARLAPGGAASVWSAAGSEEFERRLRGHFGDVRTLEVPVSRGEPDVVWVAREPRAAGARVGPGRGDATP